MNLYSEDLLDHAKNPRKTGKLPGFTHAAFSANTFCGDGCTVELEIKNHKVKDLVHRTEGCMVAVAAASKLAQFLPGKSEAEILALTESDIQKLIGINLTMTRIKCAMLPLFTVQKAIRGEK